MTCRETPLQRTYLRLLDEVLSKAQRAISPERRKMYERRAAKYATRLLGDGVLTVEQYDAMVTR